MSRKFLNHSIGSVRKFINLTLIPRSMPLVWSFVKIVRKHWSDQKSRERFQVLLVVQNNVALDHIKMFPKLFSSNHQIEFTATNDRFPIRDISENEIRSELEIPYIHIIFALVKYWDLIIYVNHPWGFGSHFAPFLKKIYINHGIWIGKINNSLSEDGVYGPSRVNRYMDQPLYDLMYTTSEYESQRAATINPKLENKLIAAGSPRLDQLEHLQKNSRGDIRDQLGYKKNRTVVFIVSTWGKHSLYQTFGEALLQQATQLNSDYHFVFSLHPRYDEFGDPKNRRRAQILSYWKSQGIETVDGIDWENHLISSDLAITDHTSMSLYFVLLNKPLILSPVPQNSYIPGSPFEKLQSFSPKILNPEDLEDSLISMITNGKQKLLPKYKTLNRMIRANPGQAAEKYRESIWQLLTR